MGLRNLQSILHEQDQAAALRKQVRDLRKQIEDAEKALEDAQSQGSSTGDMGAQLSAIHKQIQAKNLANTETTELNYYLKLVDDLTAKVNAMRHHQTTQIDEAEDKKTNPQLDACMTQIQPLLTQNSKLKTQILDLKKQLQPSAQIGKYTKRLEKIQQDTERATSSGQERETKKQAADQKKIANAQRYLDSIKLIDPIREQMGGMPQQQKLSPEEQKKLDSCNKRKESLTREQGGLNRVIAQLTTKISKLQTGKVNEETMSGWQGGYPDANDGDSYTFQSKGPLGSQPELEDEGFTTFYGDSDDHWSGYNFDSGGPELGEDPETLGEERYQVNYNPKLQEKFASKDQMKYLYINEPEAAEKLASKMTKKDYKKLPKKVKKKKNKKEGRIKELQMWGVNSNPGFGLGEVPRDSMTDYQSKLFNPMNIGPMENRRPRMKKGKLLEYLSELTTRGGAKGKVYKKKDLTKSSAPFITEAPIDYEDRPERINPDIERKLASQDTAFGKDFPGFPKVDDDAVESNYEELVASKRFKDVVDTFKRYTGVEGNATDMRNLMGLQGMMMQALQNTLRIEASNKQRLEELAIEIVTKDLNVPEGSLQFDVEITGMKKLDKDDMKRKPQNKEESLEQEQETMEHIEELDLEVAKRRFINAMMQGSAKKALYLYHMVSDELNEIDQTLMNLYGVVISANDLMYWILPDMMGGGGGEGAPVFGKEKIDLSTTPPTVVAKGMTFPVLVHELHKGVMEYLSLHGLPGDKELRQKVMDKTDFLEDEMWDLRLGPGLWERFIDAIGADDFDIKNHLYSEIIQMPAAEFLKFMKELQSGSKEGKEKMVDLAKKIKSEIQQDDYEEATGEYDEEGELSTPEIDEELPDINIDDLFPPSAESPEEMDIDSLLDKISEKGIESLTPEEIQFLEDQSK